MTHPAPRTSGQRAGVSVPAPVRRAAVALTAALLLAALLPAPAAFAQAAPHPPMPQASGTATAPAHSEVTLTGRIQGLPEGMSAQGAKVALVRHTLSEAGGLVETELGSQTTEADGAYVFKQVPVTPRSLYRIKINLGENEFGSQGFPIAGGQATVHMNVPFPSVSEDVSGVRINEALVAVEPHRGGVLVTQVAHLNNGGTSSVDGDRKPLELRVPEAAKNLEIVRPVEPGAGYEHVGDRLLLHGNLPPGRTTVAVRYRLESLLGSVDMEPQFPYPLEAFSVLVPAGTLGVSGPGLTPQGPRTIQDTRYDIWFAPGVEAHTPLPLRVSGVPLRQQVLLLPIAAFAVLMVGVVVWFLRRRLANRAEA